MEFSKERLNQFIEENHLSEAKFVIFANRTPIGKDSSVITVFQVIDKTRLLDELFNYIINTLSDCKITNESGYLGLSGNATFGNNSYGEFIVGNYTDGVIVVE